MRFRIEPMLASDAAKITGWRYPPPYDTYELGDDASHLLVASYRYHTVVEGDELIGYCCFGADATVPGGRYRESTLEVGWGMRPDLMGQGRGRVFVREIVAFADRTYAPESMGVTIAEFNERSQRAAHRAGFSLETGRFTAADGMRFVQFLRTGGPPSAEWGGDGSRSAVPST